ncbi:CLUMA_CG005238, isoform A [Clunio marinus]|uniref:CLUMA_CG005238, isoform A n=1 Tax=Clunio marinus TaxID=568069 RepID=A0A1J1HU35_9DIPT|nr:CLUMA_CG005238, isoform A [Clunio marinus]
MFHHRVKLALITSSGCITYKQITSKWLCKAIFKSVFKNKYKIETHILTLNSRIVTGMFVSREPRRTIYQIVILTTFKVPIDIIQNI